MDLIAETIAVNLQANSFLVAVQNAPDGWKVKKKNWHRPLLQRFFPSTARENISDCLSVRAAAPLASSVAGMPVGPAKQRCCLLIPTSSHAYSAATDYTDDSNQVALLVADSTDPRAAAFGTNMLLGCVRAGRLPTQDSVALFERLGSALVSGGVPPASRLRVCLLLAALAAAMGAAAVGQLVDTALQLGDTDEVAGIELALQLLTATAEETLLRGRAHSLDVGAELQAQRSPPHRMRIIHGTRRSSCNPPLQLLSQQLKLPPHPHRPPTNNTQHTHRERGGGRAVTWLCVTSHYAAYAP